MEQAPDRINHELEFVGSYTWAYFLPDVIEELREGAMSQLTRAEQLRIAGLNLASNFISDHRPDDFEDRMTELAVRFENMIQAANPPQMAGAWMPIDSIPLDVSIQGEAVEPVEEDFSDPAAGPAAPVEAESTRTPAEQEAYDNAMFMAPLYYTDPPVEEEGEPDNTADVPDRDETVDPVPPEARRSGRGRGRRN